MVVVKPTCEPDTTETAPNSPIARASGASLVVMGHAHVVTDRDGYSNTGSFAFPRGAPGRPFIEIEGGKAARRFWPQVGANTST